MTYLHHRLNFDGKFTEVQKFVNCTGEFKDLEIWSDDNHFRVDAHSLLGVLSLDISKPVKLIYRQIDKEQIETVFKEWFV